MNNNKINNKNDKFNLIMISSQFEMGGNITLKYLTDHPNIRAYFAESQIGTNESRNVMIPFIHPVRYGYPTFEEGTAFEEAYEAIWDEEAKTYLRCPDRSKFRNCGIVMKESERKSFFLEWCNFLKAQNIHGARSFRSIVIESYFRSFFNAWENLNLSGHETHHLGYCPGFSPSISSLFKDFPDCHVIQVVRSPYSAWADYQKRPFPQQSLEEYCMAYNIGHMIGYNATKKYEGHAHLLRMEDLINDPKTTLTPILEKIGLPWSDNLLKPSFQGKDLSNGLYPFGTVEVANSEYNKAMARSLDSDTYNKISKECSLLIEKFGYENYGK